MRCAARSRSCWRDTEGVANFNAIVGFSLLYAGHRQQQRLLLRRPEAVGRAHARRSRRAPDRQPTQRANCAAWSPRRRCSRSCRRRFPGSALRAASLWAAGSQRRQPRCCLNDNVQKFLAAARRAARAGRRDDPRSRAAVPQVFADVDRDKVLKQGVALGDVYQTMQAFLGGVYVNQFNRFGRQWRVFLQAEGADRDQPGERSRSSTCATTTAHGAAVDAASRPGRHSGRSTPTASTSIARRRSPARAAPGYSSGQALDALEEVARRRCRRTIGYDWADLSYQERSAPAGTAGCSRCRSCSCS